MLRAQTLFPYRRVVRPKQQRGDKTRRMAWCTVERGRSADGWANTWFADEKHFRLHARPNRKNDIVWARSPGVVPVAPSEKYAGTVSVYGAFSKHGVSKLYIFKGNNNSTEMAMIMGKTLVPSVLAAQHGKEVWYLHDNDSKCQAAVVTGVLDANGIKRWQKGVFPARSPDLNPIENAWGGRGSSCQRVGTGKHAGVTCRNFASVAGSDDATIPSILGQFHAVTRKSRSSRTRCIYQVLVNPYTHCAKSSGKWFKLESDFASVF
jgi:hypothetical protein